MKYSRMRRTLMNGGGMEEAGIFLLGRSGDETPQIYETVKIYTDYNGDGVFDESTEKVLDANGAYWRSTLGYDGNSRPSLRWLTSRKTTRSEMPRGIITGWHGRLNAAKDDVSELDNGFYLLVVKSNGTEPITRKVLIVR